MSRLFLSFVVFAICTELSFGQATAATNSPAASTGVIRIWVSDKEVNGVKGQISSVDLLKELSQKCTGVVLTDAQEKADYRLEAGYAWCCTPRGESRGYKFALFNKDGDAVFSTKTHTLANAVKDACNAIGRRKEN